MGDDTVIVRTVLPPEHDEAGQMQPWHTIMVKIDTTKREPYSAFARVSKELGIHYGFQVLIDEACDQIREAGYEPVVD